MPQHQVTLRLEVLATKHTAYNIILKPASEEYDSSAAELRSYPETRKYLRYMPEHTTTEDARASREKWAYDKENFNFDILLFEKDEDKPVYVGVVGISRMDVKNRNCYAGVIISPRCYHRGIATVAMYLLLDFAFHTTIEGCKPLLHRVLFQTGTDNVGMRGWLENTAKIRLEGTFKEHWKETGDGGWSDVALYGLLESEWREEIKGRLERKIGIL